MELGKNRALAYKVLGENGEAFHGGTGSWPLPKNGKPGKWLFVEGAIQPCVNGLHLCRRDDLVHWLGPTIWEVEYDTREVVEHDNKIVVRRARLLRRLDWNETNARLFATDCAAYAIRRARSAGIGVPEEADAAVFVEGTVTGMPSFTEAYDEGGA